ncbi:MAG: class I SAM-dependent methyltransferase [Chloroflexi bacterium]|nr:MAG: class I SAM-dependent methyltransferase [Chloroflexota bacterium]
MEDEFVRYLAAKKTVDDRALNKDVWQKLVEIVPQMEAKRPFRILEVGAGIGTMVERLITWSDWQHVDYHAIDAMPQNIQVARQRLKSLPPGWRVQMEAIDLYDFIAREQGKQTWALLIAHAFLDLVDVSTALPRLFSLLPPKGLFYFTINFDGETILEPVIDASFDKLVMTLYHQTMDERLVNGRPSGDSHTGRHLFAHLQAVGGDILAAGSSDWVVFAGENGRYPADEAWFLHFIIHTIHQALKNHPQLEPARFEQWIARRHAQIKQGELVYIAHQLDFVGYKQGKK